MPSRLSTGECGYLCNRHLFIILIEVLHQLLSGQPCDDSQVVKLLVLTILMFHSIQKLFLLINFQHAQGISDISCPLFRSYRLRIQIKLKFYLC